MKDIEKLPASEFTKREAIAKSIMAALLSDVETQRWIQTDPRYSKNGLPFCDVVAINSIEFTDALLRALDYVGE